MEKSHIICPICNASKDSGISECPDCGYVFSGIETSNNEEGIYKKRRPFLAMFYQFLAPGLGHLYNGQIKKAIIVFLNPYFFDYFTVSRIYWHI